MERKSMCLITVRGCVLRGCVLTISLDAIPHRSP
jgi:hypothetical protein